MVEVAYRRMLPGSMGSDGRGLCHRNLLPCLSTKYQMYMAVLGGVLVHLTIGTVYSIGNMAPYIVSYLRVRVGADVGYGQMSWLMAMAFAGHGSALMIGGVMERRFGPRLTTAFGSTLVSLGVICTYFTVQIGLVAFVMSYCLLFGIGVGFVYGAPMVCAMKWMPERKGLATGVIVAGFGCGALIFTPIQTSFINPGNLKPDQSVGQDKFFGQDEVLDRVPKVFLLLGSCYAVLQLVGCCLIANPPLAEVNQAGLLAEDEMDDDHLDASTGGGQFDEGIGEPKGVLDTIAVDTPTLDVEPLALGQSPAFYLLWFSFFFMGQIILFVGTYYKAYGQTFISDDHVLSTIGSVASIFNALGRVVWGAFADRHSYQVAMALCCIILVVLLATLQVPGSAVVYGLWLCLTYASFAGTFALLPLATAKCFGQRYFGINYGVVFTSQIATSLIAVSLSSALLHRLGYQGMFYIMCFMAIIGLALTVALSYTVHGRRCTKRGMESNRIRR